MVGLCPQVSRNRVHKNIEVNTGRIWKDPLVPNPRQALIVGAKGFETEFRDG